MDLIYFILTAYGLTQILVYSKIFEKIRPARDQYGLIGYMANCSMCMGFWVGVFLFLINGFTELFTFDYNVINAFICGCVSAGTSYLISMLVDDSGFRGPQKEVNCNCSQRSKL
ncbi:MAG: hypothetical protein GOVbin1807_108 [Prokaryotic dsDNA virus sp.]|nr:MAG: hypothetical protein GOVbin1807_108 [Prokaryotic dsDNA virus sp.]